MKHLTRRSAGHLRYTLPAAVLAACVGLAACGSAGQTSSGTSISTDSPAGTTSSSSQAIVQTAQLWGPDNCLHNYILVAGRVLADTSTNLCRTETTLDGQTAYYVFARGNSANWVALYETPGDGYIYVTYPTLTWFREPTGGGTEQIQVQYNNGSKGYQDLSQWAADASRGFLEGIQLRLAELAVSRLISQTYTTPINSSTLTAGQQQQGQQRFQQQGQRWQNSQQQINSNATPSGNSQADAYEYQLLTQLNGKEDQIWTSDDCNTSDNYDECDF